MKAQIFSNAHIKILFMLQKLQYEKLIYKKVAKYFFVNIARIFEPISICDKDAIEISKRDMGKR